MAYAARAAFAARCGLERLAQAAAPDAPAVDGPLLSKALQGAALTGESASVRAAAAAALARIDRELDDASAVIDGWIGARHPTVPDPAPEPLPTYCVDIARWRLFGGDPDSEERRAHDDALAWLRRVADGRAHLSLPEGAGDAASGGEVVALAPPAEWTDARLAAY